MRISDWSSDVCSSDLDSITAERLAATVLALGGVTLVVGFILSILAIRATVDPISSVRAALGRVGEGELDTQVTVYDGIEVGLLQAGFNEMVSRLQERERIRDLFERHVGEDVARDAIGREAEIGGEVRHDAVLFVDVVGSTQLARRLPPTAGVALPNRLFHTGSPPCRETGG